MKKLIIILVMFSLSITLIGQDLGYLLTGKSGDSNAIGWIEDLEYPGSIFRVQGSTENGPLWLAWSILTPRGNWIDYDPVEVEGMFDETITLKLDPAMENKLRVSLWRYKIRDSDYPLGFRMAERIAGLEEMP